jgi:hypothetical protein
MAVLWLLDEQQAVMALSYSDAIRGLREASMYPEEYTKSRSPALFRLIASSG